MMGSNSKYIKFADPEVARICIANWSSDGIGLTSQDAAAVTSQQFGTTFQGNTSIVSFDEFQYFTGVTSLASSAFSGCSSLVSITLPDGFSFEAAYYVFDSCSSLSSIRIVGSHYGTKTGGDVFQGCSSLKNIYANNYQQLLFLLSSDSFNFGNIPFRASGGGRIYLHSTEVTNAVIPSEITAIPFLAFINCTNIVKVELPSTTTLIGTGAFVGCSSLATVVIRATTPPSLETDYGINNPFANNAAGRKIYVPYSAGHSILAAYQSAWSVVSNDIFELNPDGTIPS